MAEDRGNLFGQSTNVVFTLCLMLFSLGTPGAPDERLGVDPKDVDPSVAGDGSRQKPFIVRRDNPWVGGELKVTDATVEAQVSSKFLSDGVWKSLLGHFKFRENREHAWRYADQ